MTFFKTYGKLYSKEVANMSNNYEPSPLTGYEKAKTGYEDAKIGYENAKTGYEGSKTGYEKD